MIIADTDVLIDFLRGKSPAADRAETEISSGKLCTTAVTAFELWSGAKSSKQLRSVEALLAALTILPFDARDAKRSAEIQLNLQNKKQPIGMADSLIAGICLERGAVLLTRNRKHFEHVEGLRLAD